VATESIFVTTSIACIYRALSIVNEVNLDPSGNGYTNGSLQHGPDGSLQHGSDGLHSMDQMDLYSTEYFMLLIVTWYLSQVLPFEYDKWHFVFSTLFRKLFGIGETKQDRRKVSWRAVYPRR